MGLTFETPLKGIHRSKRPVVPTFRRGLLRFRSGSPDLLPGDPQFTRERAAFSLTSAFAKTATEKRKLARAGIHVIINIFRHACRTTQLLAVDPGRSGLLS